MKGNFQLDIAGVNVQFDYVVNPHYTDHSNYDLVFLKDGHVMVKEKAVGDNPLITQMIPLSKVVFQRVHEQKSIQAQSIGVNLK